MYKRQTIDRKPSHLGSKLSGPRGISLTGLASIGATGGITGRRMTPSSLISPAAAAAARCVAAVRPPKEAFNAR